MSGEANPRAAELRDAFDRSFAVPREDSSTDTVDLLAIEVGDDPHIVRLAEIAGAFVDRKITRVPSDVPALIGIAGFRGAIVPVFDLATLLGYPATAVPRWLLATHDQVALAIASFTGHVRVSLAAIVTAEGPAVRTHVREVVRIGDSLRPIVQIGAAVDAIRQRLKKG